jgi:hypothetical protein
LLLPLCLQVGALSAINGVAASFAEEIPVLSIVGERLIWVSQQLPGSLSCSLQGVALSAESRKQLPVRVLATSCGFDSLAKVPCTYCCCQLGPLLDAYFRGAGFVAWYMLLRCIISTY